MAFRLVFTKSALDDIKHLDSVARRHLGLKLQQYQKEPLKYAKKLISPIMGQYRWRVGNYRIIFDIIRNEIIILRVGHRKEIYK